MKKSLLVLVMAVFMAASFGSAFAGPFSDVPKSHWAYEAVNNLAAKGLLEGYADGKFKGAKAMTRYEMALMVARLIDKKFGGADFDTLQKLTVEFADELALLGVKVQALEEEVKVVRNDVDALKSDVDMLKKGGMGKIKLTIEDRIRFEENKYKSLNAGVADIGNSRFVNRLRMNIKGNIDDNVSTFISLQDSTIHGTAIQNNPVNGGNNVTAADTNRDLYLGYIDIKNFGGEVIDNFRAGRMTLTIGKAFVFDNEVDGLMVKKHYRGTNFSLGGFDTRGTVPLVGAAASANDGLDAKLFTVDHSWKNVSAGAYYMSRTNSYAVASGTGFSYNAMNMAGVTLDGKIGKSVVAFLEYADQSPAKNKDLYAANPYALAAPKWKGKGFKLGAEWTVNPTWDLTLMYQDREKDFRVLSLNDDYTDQPYSANAPYPFMCTRNGGAIADNHNNAKIASFIIGYKATEKLNLDLWYEDLKGKEKLNAAGTLTNNFDQNTTQLVSTYQYKENTAFKLRYRTTKFKTGDADYVILGAGNGPADYDQVRLDLNVKF
ncbi:MAG: Outer membrane protein alpha precursor [bacterium ADurb.Bin243]|nr:MAG: Outer membrane protein alpha precursor [bacterium ADurb.Bin243]